MNPPSSSMRPSVVRLRARRGFTLLMALGLIALVTISVALSLRAVSTESALQGHERRAREALFAAEAGMAEGRMVVQAMLDNVSPTIIDKYDGVITALGAPVNEPGLPNGGAGGIDWFEVIPRTAYTLARGTANAAINPAVTGNNRELNGPDGVAIADYPEPTNVFFRVFLVDDDDGGTAPARRDDTNNQVWLVSVGEVNSPGGGQPYRTVIRSLVRRGSTPGGLNCTYGTKLGCRGNGTSGSSLPSF
ncbi:pilus assembly PilX N-terminal domain-containing protein [Pyxidicoccus sp. 3LFB2]